MTVSDTYCIFLVKSIDLATGKCINRGKEWKQGNASVGDARKASVAAIAVANESSNLIAISVARSVEHAVATAHMADHSLVAAWYALKAVKIVGKSIDTERAWQHKQLPIEIKETCLICKGSEKI